MQIDLSSSYHTAAMSSSVVVPAGFTSAQYEQLCALVDALFPALPHIAAQQNTEAKRRYYELSGVQLGIPQYICNDVVKAPIDKAAQLKTLLSILSTTAGTLALAGVAGPFSSLDLTTRQSILQSWSKSKLKIRRGAFGSVKLMSCRLFFVLTNGTAHNPTWEAIGYPGPSGEVARTIRSPISTHGFRFVSPPSSRAALVYDVVVVGSGCGGGVVASELAQAGYRVLVLEKSTYIPRSDMTLLEYESMAKMYENGGVIATEEGSVSIFAGSTFGGGSTINWSASLRTPKHVTDEWATEHGCTYFATPKFQESLDFVEQRLGVHDTQTVHSTNNETLKRGCDRLQYNYKVIPRNAPGSHSCGFCPFGCKSGEKQSAVQTFLADAAQAGADFMVQAFVERVLRENGQACGVVVSLATGQRFVVRSKVVCVSAGSIHTPAVLLRSKIENANIGKHLRLHPVSMVYGFMQEQTRPWDGCMMSIVCKQFEQRHGGFYGSLIETPPTHPGSAGAIISWKSSEQLRADMLRYTNMAVLIVLVRDRDSGTVTIDQDGRPRLSYNISDHDLGSLREGMEGGLRILAAAGAEKISSVLWKDPSFCPTSTDPNDPQLERYVRKIRKAKYVPTAYPLYSAHQMGSCRMGRDRATSVLQQTGEAWDVRNLFVADASVFPTSSGVNPMITTYAIAHSVAQNIKQRLAQTPKL
eukprot:TRINITY_DN3760_c0_g1_i3.p1 TRINITY_DN3760_c0_g1~~TRINITY_DN3760_c0_g1_i3.p1  ORF type:complete len:698 (+),score=147.73 TRINITY_DN3760_c0_g1_i3:2377-4470(+)